MLTNSKSGLLNATSQDLKKTLIYTSIELDVSVKDLKTWFKNKEFNDAVIFYREKLWAQTEKKLSQLVQGNNIKALLHQRECLNRDIADASFALEKLKHKHAKELLKYKKELDKKDLADSNISMPDIKIEIKGKNKAKDKLDKLLEDK